MVANFLLTYTGFFRDMWRLAMGIAATLTAAIGVAWSIGLDVVGLLGTYATVYAAGAMVYVVVAFKGPIAAARKKDAAPC